MLTTEVVVIGGSHAGLGIAKTIINTVPSAKVTVISTSKDYYFNIAAPRILACPDKVGLDEVLFPIERLFRKHPESQFEFIHASVTKLDIKLKTITTDSRMVISYHYLVIASGSMSCALHSCTMPYSICINEFLGHTLSPTSPWDSTLVPFKHPFQDTIRTSIPRAQNDIASALRIVIAGGGPLGIELASEIAEQYPDKTITMVFASFRFLEDLKQAASIEAGKKLNKMGIVVRSGVKVSKIS